MPPLSFGHFPRERGKTEWVEGDGSVRPSGLLVGADYLLRIRALESQSHSGRVVDLRCVLTYPQLLAGTVADRLGKLLMLTRSMCRPSRRPGFHYSIVDILA